MLTINNLSMQMNEPQFSTPKEKADIPLAVSFSKWCYSIYWSVQEVAYQDLYWCPKILVIHLNLMSVETYSAHDIWMTRGRRGVLQAGKPAYSSDTATRKKISTICNKVEDLIQKVKHSDEHYCARYATKWCYLIPNLCKQRIILSMLFTSRWCTNVMHEKLCFFPNKFPIILCCQSGFLYFSVTRCV